MHSVAKLSGIALVLIALALTAATPSRAENEAYGGVPIEAAQEDPMATLSAQVISAQAEGSSIQTLFSTATIIYRAQVPASKRKIITAAKPTPTPMPETGPEPVVASTDEATTSSGESTLLTQTESEPAARAEVEEPAPTRAGATGRLLQAVKKITR